MRQFKYKPVIIHVNMSSSFMARSHCKKCGGTGKYHYWQVRLPTIFRDHTEYKKYFAITLKWYGAMNNDWYLEEEPRNFDSAHDFSFTIEQKSYKATLHHTGKGNWHGFPISMEIGLIGMVTCDCGHTSWAISPYESRPEITNRKSRSTYPNKIEY